MQGQTVTVVGGTGFVGKYVVRELAKAGFRLRVISRNPEAAKELKTAGDPGQIVLVAGNLTRPESITPHINGSYAVVNLVGILFEGGGQQFSTLHAQGAERLAQAAKAAKVPYFVHMSSLGVDKAITSKYARTKMLGEKAVRAAFPEATILRPSVMFGPEDNFYNQFAKMATVLPFLPLIGGGRTQFQPVYVGDVADAVRACLQNPATRGNIYELGGPQTYTFKQILDYIRMVTLRSPLLLPLPFGLAALGATFAELLPRPPLTRDQVRLLRYDNVVDKQAAGFAALGIQPTSAEIIVPDYLGRYRPTHGQQPGSSHA